MATAADYGLGPNTYPRGWFIVAESSELDSGPMAVRFSGQDLALYRGESGKPVLPDAYCAHMGTHLTASTSAMIVKNGEQIEGDSIRCPYHGWRYNSDGDVDDIPYSDGPFRTARKWYSQFYDTPEGARATQQELNGIVHTLNMAAPADAKHDIDEGLPI